MGTPNGWYPPGGWAAPSPVILAMSLGQPRNKEDRYFPTVSLSLAPSQKPHHRRRSAKIQGLNLGSFIPKFKAWVGNRVGKENSSKKKRPFYGALTY